MTTTTDQLAQDIRTVDGNHTLGAGALAEALVALGWEKKPASTAIRRGRTIFNGDDIEPGTKVIGVRGNVVYEVLETKRVGRWLLGRLRDTRTGRSAGWRYLDTKCIVEEES